MTGSVASTSATRWAAAEARWPLAMIMPSIRSGQMSSTTKKLKSTKSPMLIAPSITRWPPTPSTVMSPTLGSSSSAGR